MNKEKEALYEAALEQGGRGELGRGQGVSTTAHQAALEAEMSDSQKAEYEALCAMPSRERIVKVWSTPTVEQREAVSWGFNAAAGDNQIEKAHFLRSRQEQAETVGHSAGFIKAVDADILSERLPSLMRSRINIQGTVTGRFKAAPNLKEGE